MKIIILTFIMTCLGLGAFSQSYFSKTLENSNQGWQLVETNNAVFIIYIGENNFLEFSGIGELDSNANMKDSILFFNEEISSTNAAYKTDSSILFTSYLKNGGTSVLKLRNLDFNLNIKEEIILQPFEEQITKSILCKDSIVYLLTTRKKANNFYENYLYKIIEDSIVFEKPLFPESAAENVIEIMAYQQGLLVLSDIQETNGEYKPNLIYLNLDGEVLWINKYEQMAIQSPQSRMEVSGNNIYLSQHPVQDSNIFFNSVPSILLKLDSTGNIIWKKSFAERFFKNIDDIRIARNGDLLGVGTKNSENPDEWNGSRGWIFRISSIGELIWERSIIDKRFDVFQNCALLEILELENEDIMMSGWIMDTTGTANDLKVSTWVVKVDKDGCFYENCDSSLIITSTISIENETSFKIYPNPFNTSFKIHSNSFPAKIKIYTIQGELIQQFSLFGQEKEIDTTFLPSGVYIVQLNTDSRIQVLKAVKR